MQANIVDEVYVRWYEVCNGNSVHPHLLLLISTYNKKLKVERVRDHIESTSFFINTRMS